MDAILNARASYSGLCCFSLFFPFLFLFDFSLSFSSDLFPFHSLQFFSLFQTLRFFPHLWSGWRGLYYHRSLAMHVEYILPAVNAVGAHKNSRIFSIQRVVKLKWDYFCDFTSFFMNEYILGQRVAIVGVSQSTQCGTKCHCDSWAFDRDNLLWLLGGSWNS